MWIQGIKILLAAVIFMIVPLVLAGAALFSIVITALGIAEIIGPTGITSIIVIPLAYLGLAIAFFLGLILAMTIVNMLKKDDFGKVFAFNEALTIIRKIGWGQYIVWMVVLFIITGIVTAVMFNIPVIGWILELALTPAVGAFVARSVALTYQEGTNETTETTATPTEQT